MKIRKILVFATSNEFQSHLEFNTYFIVCILVTFTKNC